MKLLRYLLLSTALACVWLGLGDGRAGWGTGSCAPVWGAPAPGGFAPLPVVASYRWVPVPDDASVVALYLGSVQVGVWDHDLRHYRALHADRSWGPPESAAPVLPPAPDRCDNPDCECLGRCRCEPCKCEKFRGVQQLPTGVEWDKLGQGASYRINGRPASKLEVFDILEKSVPDDTRRPHLTVIGSDAERKKVTDDWSKDPALAEFRDKVRVQSIPPTHWWISAYGFKSDGHPTIYYQQPDGTVLHRQDDYAGAQQLAEALRKADPNYDPNKDPDRRKPDPKPEPVKPDQPTPAPSPAGGGSIDLSKVPPAVWVIAGVAALFLLTRKQS